MAAQPDRAPGHPGALRDPLFLAAALVSFAALAWLSVARYDAYNAGMFDLGNMAQAIWSGAHGGPLLYSRPEGFAASRLGGHVEAGYLLFAPLYRLWPDPRLLLVLQAGLFALGSAGAYRLAARRTGSRFAARCAALIYLLYPAGLTGVLFDFHADTLALPALMLALDALDERAWRRFAILIAVALSMKFYIAAVVAGVGGVMFLWGGQRRAGAITAAAGVLYGLLAFFVVRPLFAAPSAGGAAAVSASYAGYYFGQLSELGLTAGERLLNALVVFGPALFVARRGWRWLLPALPVAAAALLSTGPGGAFDFRYHHYGVVVPFIVMATVDGAARMRAEAEARRALPPERRRPSGRSWQGDLGLTAGIVVLCAALLVNIPLNPLFWLRAPGYGMQAASYGATERDALKGPFLARIPEGAPVAASNFLAAHLADRPTLYLLRYPDEQAGARRIAGLLPQVQYAAADALFDFYLPIEGGYAGGLDGDRDSIALLLRGGELGLVGTRDGLLLFERGAGGRALQNTIEPAQDDGARPLASFGGAVDLVRATAEPEPGGRARLTFVWRVTGGFGKGRFVAVSRLDGVPGGRIVHLPGYALRPAWEWRPGELLVERFEVELPPAAPGSYRLLTGWYDVGAPTAYLTDARARLPGSEEVQSATLAVGGP